MESESSPAAAKTKCSDKNNITCNLFVSLCVLNIYLIEHHIGIASKHIAKFFKISSHNVAIFIVKLYSSFSLSSAIGSIIEFFVDHLIIKEFLYSNIGISASISLSRFLFVIFSYRPPSLIFFYILINFDALITGLYKMLIFVNFPSYAATCVFSRDVSAFSISLLQAVLDICIGRSPSTLRIEYFIFLCASFSTLNYFIKQDPDIKNSYTDPINNVNALVSQLFIHNADLESEIHELGTLVKEVLKINKLQMMKKHLASISESIPEIQQIGIVEELKGLENLINEIKPEEIKKNLQKNYIQVMILAFKKMKKELSEKPKESKNPQEQNKQTEVLTKKTIKENLKGLNYQLTEISKKIKTTRKNFQKIVRIYYEDINTYPPEINQTTDLLSNTIKLEVKLENLIVKSSFEKLEDIINQTIQLLEKINIARSLEDVDVIEIHKNYLEEVKDINNEINKANEIMKQIKFKNLNKTIQNQVNQVDSKIQVIKDSLNGKIKTLNESITLNYEKSKSIEDLISKNKELKEKTELSVIKDGLKNIEKFEGMVNLKILMFNLKKNYKIPEILGYMISLKQKNVNLIKKKKEILEMLEQAGLKSESRESKENIQKIKILKNSVKTLESHKDFFNQAISKIEQQNQKLKQIPSLQTNYANKLVHDLQSFYPSFIREQLSEAESSLRMIKPLGLDLVPRELSEMIIKLSKVESSLSSAGSDPLQLTQIETNIRTIKEINVKNIKENYEQLIQNKAMIQKLDEIDKIITKMETYDIEKIFKIKDQLNPETLELRDILNNFNHLPDVQNLNGLINKIKPILASIHFLNIEHISGFFEDTSDLIEQESELNNLTEFIKNKKKSEKELKELHIKYESVIEKSKLNRLEKENEEIQKVLKQIQEKEEQILQELKEEKIKGEESKQQKKEKIIKESQQLISIINVIQTKINEFGPFDHIMNTISQFTIATTTTSITHVVHPGVLPLAIVEISDCELINLYTPLFYVIGSGTVFCIDYFFEKFREWSPYHNLVWILLVPQLVIMILSFVTVHTKSKCSEQIRNSKVRIFLMLSFLLVSYSLMESMSYVGVANYVVYKSKYFKSSIDVIRYFLILISVVKFLTYKLSVGYNIVRVKHGYVAPKFEPYESDKKPNCCYLFLDIFLRSLIDIFLDFKLNIRDYT